MSSTTLSSKGQVIIPKALRESHQWQAGQKLTVVNLGDGVMLRPQSPFAETSLEEVAGCLPYSGKAKSLEEMEEAIARGIKEQEEG